MIQTRSVLAFVTMTFVFSGGYFLSRADAETVTEASDRHERVRERRSSVHLICHRGALEAAHENTLEAYRAAFELGGDGNEVDIRITKDGVLVCFHDDMIDQLLEGYGDVSDFSWHDLQMLRFRDPGRFGQYCRIPTLREVFELHRDYAGLIFLDVKRPGLQEPISELLEEYDMWDHVIHVPPEFVDTRFQPTRIKAGMYLDRTEVDEAAIAEVLRLPGERILLESPQIVAKSLGRPVKIPDSKPVRDEVALWAQPPVQPVDPRSVIELLDILNDASDWNTVAAGETAEADSAERILRRARAADELARCEVRTQEVFMALETRVRDRSLHRNWRYCGLDGCAALRALIALKAPQSADLAEFCIWRDDPGVEAAGNQEYTNPRSWTDFRTKLPVFRMLESLPGMATERICRSYLALTDDEATSIGVPQFEEAATTLLKVNPRESTIQELLEHRLSVVRGRAILFRHRLQSTVDIATDPSNDDPACYHSGELAGSLRSSDPLPLYSADPNSLVNRLFAALYIRESNIPTKRGEQPVPRIEGGDVVDFYAWPSSAYWSHPDTCHRIGSLLDECLASPEELRPADPLRRAVLLRDLWAAFDFFVGRNIARDGDLAAQQRRDDVCRRLAKIMQGLTLTTAEIQSLPDCYDLAINSGRFAATHNFDPSVDYLPPGLLTSPDEWQEFDFFQSPTIHDNLQERFLTLHTREYVGRSYFRIFYRFPGGRTALEEFLPNVEAKGIDWKTAAQNGFIALTEDAPQIPVGTEVALVQFMMTLDDQLRPTPTPVVETLRLRIFANVNGEETPPTNTGVGMNVAEYTFKRRLLFDRQKHGGLMREPDDQPLYRVIFMGDDAPDWGDIGRSLTISQDCRRCHTGAAQKGVQTMFSLFNQGGFSSGAQMGISHTLPANTASPRGPRAAGWKTRHETYRRLLDYVQKPESK